MSACRRCWRTRRTRSRKPLTRAAGHRNRIALIGLRGAGKSTIGPLLADHLRAPFLELDREIEKEAGIGLTEIMELHGQAGFRRLEHWVLDRLIDSYPKAVIAAGGGIVAEATTFTRLLEACLTVWIKASPDEHMQRVIDQGDLRPMRDNRSSMADLRAILASREALYARADHPARHQRAGLSRRHWLRWYPQSPAEPWSLRSFRSTRAARPQRHHQNGSVAARTALRDIPHAASSTV